MPSQKTLKTFRNLRNFFTISAMAPTATPPLNVAFWRSIMSKRCLLEDQTNQKILLLKLLKPVSFDIRSDWYRSYVKSNLEKTWKSILIVRRLGGGYVPSFLLYHILGIILHYYIFFYKIDSLIIASHYLVETLNSIWIIAIFI